MLQSHASDVFFKLLSTNGCKPQTLSSYLRQAGYSESYARNPQKIKKTKKWKSFARMSLEQAEEVLLVHKKQLYATRVSHRVFPLYLSEEDIRSLLEGTGCLVTKVKRCEKGMVAVYLEPDNMAIGNALNMVYKVMGFYKS